MTGMGPGESGVFQHLVTLVPDLVRDDGPRVHVPPLTRHPGRRPGVHVDRLKVTGDIPSLPATLPLSRSDEHGFRIKSGMTE